MTQGCVLAPLGFLYLLTGFIQANICHNLLKSCPRAAFKSIFLMEVERGTAVLGPPLSSLSESY